MQRGSPTQHAVQGQPSPGAGASPERGLGYRAAARWPRVLACERFCQLGILTAGGRGRGGAPAGNTRQKDSGPRALGTFHLPVSVMVGMREDRTGTQGGHPWDRAHGHLHPAGRRDAERRPFGGCQQGWSLRSGKVCGWPEHLSTPSLRFSAFLRTRPDFPRALNAAPPHRGRPLHTPAFVVPAHSRHLSPLRFHESPVLRLVTGTVQPERLIIVLCFLKEGIFSWVRLAQFLPTLAAGNSHSVWSLSPSVIIG